MKWIALNQRSILTLWRPPLPQSRLAPRTPSALPAIPLNNATLTHPLARTTTTSTTKSQLKRSPQAASTTTKPSSAALPPFVSLLSASAAQTHLLAAKLAALCVPGDVLLLFGNVGEGKTELARGFLRSYTGMSDLIVTSPTYTVMLEYAHKGHRVHHVDLYRLETAEDLALLPLEKMFKQDISLIEWPERLAGMVPQGLSVRIEKMAGEKMHKRHSRVITLSATTEPWRSRIEHWREMGIDGLQTYRPD